MAKKKTTRTATGAEPRTAKQIQRHLEQLDLALLQLANERVEWSQKLAALRPDTSAADLDTDARALRAWSRSPPGRCPPQLCVPCSVSC